MKNLFRCFKENPGPILLFAGLWGFILLGNLAAVAIPGFADLWRASGFRAISTMMGVISTQFPVSLGEMSIIMGVLLTVVLLPALIFRWKPYLLFYLWTLTVVIALLTSNCYILYHCSHFQTESRRYTLEELGILRDHIVEQANELAVELPRDGEGKLIPPEDITGMAKAALKPVGERNPVYAGFTVTPKPIYHSFFLCQQNMAGYYFPFTMEANYNRYMEPVNLPATLCHELSHTKGNLYEDDANLIGFLGCILSDDRFFNYSGYLSVLGYVERDWRRSAGENPEILKGHPEISEQVLLDDIFITEETRQRVEEESPFPTKAVRKSTETFTNTVLKANGVSSGMASYGEVVGHLLGYYEGILY